ncbi:serine hydrolase domain-containing protein [Agaribacter marinus]|uniref:Beta-lactamase-related domain-containing protein n=1 Tax=Agaribacter marinus TaxID=1431249 RepID=A0AA37SXS4_9ALTE|nr:serine hydrolase domain-containing protein [Agaribacter marinus]GLR71751.1 hypothetical protein GCM10007852_26590 [Agaribacter marinus]
MNILKKIGAAGLSVLLLLTALPSAFAQQSLDGVWRGLLTLQEGVSIPIGFNITDNNSVLTMDSPNQGMKAKVPTSFTINDGKVEFTDTSLNASFSGALSGANKNEISGVFTQGKDTQLRLYKLDDTALSRMKFEGKYTGDLKVNANIVLPLALNVAVLHDGFSATLDSPAQNSYGIPIDSISIDDTTLSFASAMLNASYLGKHKQAAYVGNFTQGTSIPLTLTKVSAENAHVQYQQPDFGEQGGSVAVITQHNVEKKHIGEHTSTTQYEIGSVTKTFTTLLLAKEVSAKRLALEDSISTYFIGAPEISLVSVATHTSGLPRNPGILRSIAHPTNPFTNLTREHLKQDLASVKLTEKNHTYSNYGSSVLAEVMAVAEGVSYTDLVSKKIFEPLAMKASYVASTSDIGKGKLAQGYSSVGQAVEPWSFAAASGAGAVVANLDDMIRYVQYVMNLNKVDPQLANILFTERVEFSACCGQALGWMLDKDKLGNEFAWHNGMTAGFSAFVGFYLDGSRAVVLLNNQAVPIDNQGRALLFDENTIARL